jgi:NAD(P)-dependent dehydrogenase (short-subunit alcohol dehydrogenase family)
MPRVLVTGCSTGIGRATALEMTRRGYEVVATARRPDAIEDLDVALRLQLDVDDGDSVRRAFQAAGALDVLINNAAWELAGPVEKVPIDRVQAMFETNVFGALRTIQAVVPRFREQGSGIIVNVSSVAGRVVFPLSGTYSATKFALEALSEAMYYELSHFGIRVVVVEPGETATAWAANEEWHGADAPPYDNLFQQMYGDRSYDGTPGPEIVAAEIIAAIESDDALLRWPGTPRAAAILAARQAMDDRQFEAAQRDWMSLDW